MKIMVLGDRRVGKSEIVEYLKGNPYGSIKIGTVGANFALVDIKVENTSHKVIICDMSGGKNFANVQEKFYDDLKGLVYVFDITNQSSIDDLMYWTKEIENRGLLNLPVVLLGNKIDLQTEEVAKDLISSMRQRLEKLFEQRIPYYETSAKDGSGIWVAFEDLIGKVVIENQD